MTFQQIKQWHFEPEMSKGGLEDEVVSINMVAVVSKESGALENKMFFKGKLDKSTSHTI